jgi:phosphoribosylaminoimidazole-succinocarboxamide synthase
MSAPVTTVCLDDIDLPLSDKRVGKVRISWALPDVDTHQARRLFVTTDRLSAFDQKIGLVPGKGQMLNELAWWWFTQLGAIVEHHALELPDPNVLVAQAADPLRVEVVVRRAITGVTSTSLWRRYEAGSRFIDGHRLPDGLHKNELLPSPVITPTTKGDAGSHDVPLSVSDVVDQGLVDGNLWSQVCDTAMAVFAYGEQVAEGAGLILADTKYEFGITTNGTLLLIDEVHTPDSSRYWERSTYDERLSVGAEPESLDKEIIRRAFVDAGYSGVGPLPVLPSQVWDDVAVGYKRAYERLTGSTLTLSETPPIARIQQSLQRAGLLDGFNGDI